MSDIKRIAERATKEAGLHTIKIKDKNYTIKLLPATKALAVATELFKVVLPSITAWFEGSSKKDLLLPEDDDTYTQAAMLLVNQMDKTSVLDLVDILSENITCNGSPVDIDDEFKGNLGGLLILLEFVLKENVGPLFKDWLEAKGIVLPSLKTTQQNQEIISEKS